MAKVRETTRNPMRENVKELKRQMLLEAAYKLFSEHGYNETSVDMITAEVGGTKAIFYYQYPDKHSILEAIFEHAFQSALATVERAIAAGGNPQEALEEIARDYTRWVIENQVLVSVIWREANRLDPDTRKRMAGKQRVIHARVADVIKEGTEAGVFLPGDPLTTARSILGMISFIYTWWRDNQGLSRSRAAEHYAQAALRIAGDMGAARQ